MSLWDKGLNIINKGLDVASDFLSQMRESDERAERLQVTQLDRHQESEQHLLFSIEAVSSKLDAVAQDVVNKISHKIESDQLEKLIANIKSMHLSLQFGDKTMLTHALMTLFEHIEYAKNRIAEDKLTWLGPWMMAESIRLAALRTFATDEKAWEAVSRVALDFRVHIIQYTSPVLIKHKQQAPWVKLAEFIQGQNEDVLKLIADTSAFEEKRLDERQDWKKAIVSIRDPVGSVAEVLVKVGDRLTSGQSIIRVGGLRSATRAEIPVRHTGVVQEINVRVGEQVAYQSIILHLKN